MCSVPHHRINAHWTVAQQANVSVDSCSQDSLRATVMCNSFANSFHHPMWKDHVQTKTTTGHKQWTKATHVLITIRIRFVRNTWFGIGLFINGGPDVQI